MGIFLYLLLAAAHQWFPGGVFERVALVLVWFNLGYGLSYLPYLNRILLVGYVWGVVKYARQEARYLMRPGKFWIYKCLMLYVMNMVFIYQGYYFVVVVLISNMVVQAVLHEALWGKGYWVDGKGGLMEHAINNVRNIRPSEYIMKA